MEKAIQKAMEGGYKASKYFKRCDKETLITLIELELENKDSALKYECLLDPLFWQALGKAEGWKEMKDYEIETRIDPRTRPDWIRNWHRFIDHLAEGGSADDFFNNLLSK